MSVTKRPTKIQTLQDVYDLNRAMVEECEANPNIPDYVKVHLRNLAGYSCVIAGAGAMTTDAIAKNEVSPLGAMDPNMKVDFTPHMQKNMR